MKNFLASLVLLSFISTANAVFINNGNNTISDDATGLDWLALSVTSGTAYAVAETINTGWRYATNSEVETMFTTLFPSFSTTRPNGVAINEIPALRDESAVFQSLFGITRTNITYGLYLDENSLLTTVGAYLGAADNLVFGLNYSVNYSSNAVILAGRDDFGVYLVRDTVVASVAESSSIYLLAFGLLGLLGTVRKIK